MSVLTSVFGSLGRRFRRSGALVLGAVAMAVVLSPSAVGAQGDDAPVPAVDDGGGGQADANCGLGGFFNDALEDNDNAGQASPITDGVPITGLTSCDGDDDYFIMFASANSLLTVDVTFLHDGGDGDIDVELENNFGTVVANANSGTDNEQLTYLTPSSNFYYPRVFKFGGGDTTDYDITMTRCQDDQFESNDTQATAEPITSGVQISGGSCGGTGIGDDYYEFPVTAGDLIDVELLFTHADGDLELRLYDEADNLETSRTSSTDDETIANFVADSTGTWAVKVDPVASQENTYDLTVTVTTPCSEDGFEPNDTQAAAEPITSGVQIAGSSCGGSVGAGDDWFSFPVTAGDLIDVELLFTHADGDLDLDLYDEAENRETSRTSSDDNETITNFVADSTGTWAVRVDPIASQENTYDLTVTVTTPCSEDGFEPNDTQAAAEPITSGVQIAGSSCGGSVGAGDDWFSFPVTAGDLIDVELLFTNADGDLELALYDEAENFETNRVSSSDNETIDGFVADSTGTWAVKVDPVASQENTYDLTVTVTTPCSEDGFEPNDTQATAEPISSGTQIAGSSCGGSVGAGDDWFSFPVTAGDLIDVELLFTNADGDLELRLYDEAENLETSRTSSSDNEIIDAFFADSTGTWAVWVYPIASEENTYDLTVTVTPGGLACPGDDGFESNDTQATAEPITSGVQVSGLSCGGTPTGDDYFSFPVTAGDTIDVDLLFTHADGDLELRLYDEAENQEASRLSSSDNETISGFVADSTGTWAVRVDPVNAQENTYDLTVTVTPLACPGDDGFEPNDTQATAEPITSGVQVSGISCGGTGGAGDDYFSFPVFAGDTIDVDLLFTHADGNLELRLFDDQGNLETSRTTSTDDETITGFVADTSGTWTVWVQPDGTDENTYGLTVTATSPPCVDDPFEDNESIATATPVLSGVPISAVACDGDIDVYSYAVNAGDTIQVDATFTHADGDIDIDIGTNNQGEPALIKGDSETDNESISWVATTSGTYTTIVNTTDGSDNTYDLLVTVTPPGGATCNGLAATLVVPPGGANFFGTGGDDVIVGTSGVDNVFGLGGNDTICGFGGDDNLNGGNGMDWISGGEDNDFVAGQGQADEVYGDGGDDQVIGGIGNDMLFGGPGMDLIRGQGNNDVIDGGSEVDVIFGGSGNDEIMTGSGGNRGVDCSAVWGSFPEIPFGTCPVTGNGNNDTITGSSTDDDLDGQNGLDIVNGGGGNDLLRGGLGADTLNGDGGDDTLQGAGSADTLNGGDDNDSLSGGSGAPDRCNGDGGTDTLADGSCEIVTGVP